MDNNEIGKFFASLREQGGYSQRDFAEKIHVSQPTLSRWESGARQPKLSDLEDVCRTLGIPVPLYFQEIEPEQKPDKQKFGAYIIASVVAGVILIFVLGIIVFFSIPRYRVIDDTKYVDGSFGHALTVTVEPVFGYNQEEAEKFSRKLSVKYKKREDIDAVEIVILRKDRKGMDYDPDSIYMSTTYIITTE
jgi:transcriptional regulator with XRE-family HTH domain